MFCFIHGESEIHLSRTEGNSTKLKYTPEVHIKDLGWICKL